MSAMLAFRALISGIIIAIVSVVSRRYPGLGAEATFYYVIPSLPMFLLIPILLRRGVSFAPALIAGCAVTILLYLLTVAIAARMGIRL